MFSEQISNTISIQMQLIELNWMIILSKWMGRLSFFWTMVTDSTRIFERNNCFCHDKLILLPCLASWFLLSTFYLQLLASAANPVFSFCCNCSIANSFFFWPNTHSLALLVNFVMYCFHTEEARFRIGLWPVVVSC